MGMIRQFFGFYSTKRINSPQEELWYNRGGIGHFRVLLCLCFKTSLSANLSYENEFCMQFHSHANQSHFHNNGFALRLALKQRHKGTRKWPIACVVRWQHTVLCMMRATSKGLNDPSKRQCIIPWKGCIIPRKGFKIPREEWITANTVTSWFLRHLWSPSDVAGLIADSVLHCLAMFQQGMRLLDIE